MLASQLIGNAIAELHGVPSAKGRRLELRHLLIDRQAAISDEMATLSRAMDLSDLVRKIRDEFSHFGLLDSLFIFALIDAPPKPEDLEREAIETIRKHPLSSLFGAAHFDDEGKVIYRTDGAGSLGNAGGAAIRRQISQTEGIRQNIVAASKIEPARQITVRQHYVSDDVLAAVLQYSGFVPPDLVATFARGFSRFFQGYYTSATYVLMPLLENFLRYVLKSHRHDVTIFDNTTQTQQDRTISSLFEQMRPELDAIFTRSSRTTSIGCFS